MKFSAVIIAFVCLVAKQVQADTPANCSYEEIKGVWTFAEGPRDQDKHVDCTSFTGPFTNYTVMLEFPDVAVDLDGNVGFWTLIYNQGFEVVIKNRKYFAFSFFTQDGPTVTSQCGLTFTNSSHNVGVNPVNWSCFYGRKSVSTQAEEEKLKKIHDSLVSDDSKLEKFLEQRKYSKNSNIVKWINALKTSWTAKNYKFMSKMSLGEVIRMAGGRGSQRIEKPKPAAITPEQEAEASQLPESFDWRNVNGINYVSPVRNQLTCGSCYAFASMAMHEARLRIKSNNTRKTIFSTQDIVECSDYSQGCNGGFPYLVAGKYAEDFGLVEEACNPYKGVDGNCSTNPECKRHYATNYRYIGGFYGACNEALMRLSLVKNGPIAVSMEVYDDFLHYSGGVYHHTGVKDRVNFGFNPFELTNHVVLVVGYGVDAPSGQKYWIVKNSWSTEWGEDGFFRIRRGTDECAIESIAAESDIIVD